MAKKVLPKGEIDIFDEMVATAGAKQAEPKHKRNAEIIQLTGEDSERLENFCRAKSIAEIVTGHEKVAREEVLPVLMEETYEKMHRSKTKIDNPSFVNADGAASCIFQVVNDFDLDVKGEIGTEMPSVQEIFEINGLPKDVSTSLASLFEEERTLEVKPLGGLRKKNRPLADKVLRLLKGFTEEDAETIGQILRDADRDDLADKVVSGLSGEERKEVLVSGKTIVAKGGEKPVVVLNQFCRICRTPEQLATAFQTAKVEVRISSVKYNGDLGKAASTLAETPIPGKSKEMITTDKKYRATVEGKQATLWYTKNQDDPIGTKECRDERHAYNTAKKWVSNSAYLNEALIGFGVKP